MNTTPEQRAQWAKLADSITGNSHPDGDDAVELVDAAVPALCKDVEELEAQLTEVTDRERLFDALAQRRGQKLERLQNALRDWENREAAVCPEDVGFEEVIKAQRAQVERLTALLREVAPYANHTQSCNTVLRLVNPYNLCDCGYVRVRCRMESA